MLPTYAAYLFAQFRETRAYRPILALLNLEGDLAEQFFGDSITGDVHKILACGFDGDETPLRALIGFSRNDPCPCGSGRKFKKCCG